VRKFGVIAILVFSISGAAFAQVPSGNIFVGYSYSRTDSFGGTKNLNGWEGSLEGKFLPWIGIVADFGAGYGKDNSFVAVTCPVQGCPFTSNSLRRNTYLFGPRVSVPIGRFTPFAHALFGAAHINDQGVTDTSFATAVGGGVDYKLIKGIAWRVQLDNVHTNFFSTGENHLRFSTGIDFRF
jgi:Outer membrane protein beta-barrel domain